ncbi:MAG TPA: heme ABC exporter ATP-binding protein CcmA [Allosphingosinicella sp.]|uniref:heme ABC exporter ATP-binding protein CcmA n=1 Tax=Allosphingosinicella sp. TaxID=2823234 RepID=UPI002ED8782B
MSLLALKDVACVRGGRLLFEGVSLELEAGGTAIVTGRNGIGKSSLIRIAAGLLRPSAGDVRGERSALADEGLALDEKLTLGRALGFWAKLDGGDAGAGMEAMGLAPLAEVPVRMLSTGQRKRAALARVVASGAPLWLLDEPANGLDAEGLERLGTAMARHRVEGGAILAASHQDLPLAGAQEVKLG